MVSLNILPVFVSMNLFAPGMWGNWREVSDTIRGGISHSVFQQGRFIGMVDSKVLGGAGFTSQVTKIAMDVDLSEWKGIEIEIVGDERVYAMNLMKKARQSGAVFKVTFRN
jgi:hypothetical protein